MPATTSPTDRRSQQADLAIEGMTCAACASRIERRLNRLDGVSASVNYATEVARIDFDPARHSLDEVVAAIEATGYRARRPQPETQARRAERDAAVLVAATVLTVPVVVLGMVPGVGFAGDGWVSFALASLVVFGAGLRFHRSALANARHASATMDTLISVGTLSAFGWSTWALTAADGHARPHMYFETACVITTLVLLGRWLEHRARSGAASAVAALARRAPRSASLLEADGERTVAADTVVVGSLVVVRPGEQIPVDGVVVEGESAIDRSLLTGESLPVDIGPGQYVEGGTLNVAGSLTVRATSPGTDTAVTRIAQIVASSLAGKTAAQRLADRVAGVFVPFVIVIALATLAAWLVVTGDGERAYEAAVAVLIIACPCALGLATPTAIVVGAARGARLGILLRGPQALERAQQLTLVAIDKTGTLTEGRLEVVAVTPAPGWDRAAVLRLAGAAERGSEHPIGRAIATRARAELGPLPVCKAFQARPGAGVEAVVDGVDVRVGRPGSTALLPAPLQEGLDAAHANGRTAVLVSAEGAPAGLVTVSDRLRPESRDAVDALHALGLRVLVLSGDNERAAAAVATAVGADAATADVRPEGKVQAIQDAQRAGARVAMVGDGVNDAPALAAADLGVAVGGATDVALAAADIAVASHDVRAVADAVALARAVHRTIRTNLFWAFAYNVAAIPLAAAALLDPMVAAIAMACSSLFVVGNALRLRRFRSARPSAATGLAG